jgi:hypothetical protein
MAGFEIDHQALADAGDKLSEQGHGSREIQSKIREANVSPRSWGLLGIQLGLFPSYLTMLSSLESHLGQMQQHLTRADDAMKESATAYQDMEERITKSMKELTDQLGKTRTPLSSSGTPENPET